MKKVMLRILTRGQDGALEDVGVELSVEEELGGILPQVGDSILESGVHANLDRGDAINREFRVVEERILYPKADPDDEIRWVGLVCRVRQGTRKDQAAIG